MGNGPYTYQISLGSEGWYTITGHEISPEVIWEIAHILKDNSGTDPESLLPSVIGDDGFEDIPEPESE